MLLRRSITKLNRSTSSAFWRGAQTQTQPNNISGDETIDPEWATAKPYKSIPGPTRWQLITGFAKGGRYAGMDLIQIHHLMREEFGSLFRLPGMLGRTDIVLSFDPEDFKKLFRTEGAWPVRHGFEAMTYYRQKYRREIFGETSGLVTEQGESWQKMRSVVNPVMLQPKTVKLYIDQVDEVAREFLAITHKLRDSKGELPENFAEWINRWALETMGVLAMDTRLGVLKADRTEEGQKIVQLLRDAFHLTYQLDVLPSMWRIFKTSNFRKFMVVLDEITNITMAKIEEAKINFEQHPTAEGNQSVLEKLLKINKNIAVIMALEMIFAGIDTMSASSMGILYCLAKNPDKQAKLREELRTILPNKDSPLTAENLRNLPYLRACIKEGLRMVPPAAGNYRAAGRNIVLQGYQIPKDTDVAMGTWVLMQEDKFFNRASEFLPERWLNTRDDGIPSGKDTNPFIFLPFGFGPRSCIGRRFAMMELEVILTRLIRQYEVRWNYHEYKVRTTIFNSPISPLRFELKEVDH